MKKGSPHGLRETILKPEFFISWIYKKNEMDLKGSFSITRVNYDPFTKGRILKVIKPSEAQQEILLACFLGEDLASLSFNESISLVMKGCLNEVYLKNSILKLTEKHDSLRMIFSSDGKHGVILERMKVDFNDSDFSRINESDQEKELEKLKIREVSTVFLLNEGPLIRFRLVKLTQNYHQLIIVAHHVICDGWSFGLILEDIANFYNAQVNNVYPEDDGIQFCEYVDFFNSEIGKKINKQAENYWIEKYKDDIPKLNLPTLNKISKIRTYKGKRLDFYLKEDLLAGVKTISVASKSTIIHTLKSLFEIFIYKISGQNDFVVGLPTAGQNLVGFDKVVGHCVNLLPIRVKLNEWNSIIDFIQQRKSEMLDDLEHQNVTFGRLLQKLKIEREEGRIPLVPIVFNSDVGMDSMVNFEGIQSHVISTPKLYENFELAVNILQQGERFIMEWSFNTDLFDEPLIRYWMKIFEWITLTASNSSGMIIENILNENLDFLNSINEFNQTIFPLKAKETYLEHFLDFAKTNPKAPAIIFHNEIWSFSKLEKFSKNISLALKERKLKENSVVALYMERTPLYLAALIGVSRSRFAYLPIDSSLPIERVKYIIKDSGSALVISQFELGNSLQSETPTVNIEELVEKGSYNHFK
jgi:hypothetical protein